MATAHRRIRRNVRKYSPTRLRQIVSVEDAPSGAQPPDSTDSMLPDGGHAAGACSLRATIKHGPPGCCYNAAGSPFVHVRDSSTRRAGAGRSERLFRGDGVLARCRAALRSEEHTSELQSRLHLVCRLLLEKKKQRNCHSLAYH